MGQGQCKVTRPLYGENGLFDKSTDHVRILLVCLLIAVVQVPEDYPVNEPVTVVHADDADRGSNAELSYILDTASQLQYGQIFRLHRSTGEVHVGACNNNKAAMLIIGRGQSNLTKGRIVAAEPNQK